MAGLKYFAINSKTKNQEKIMLVFLTKSHLSNSHAQDWTNYP